MSLVECSSMCGNINTKELVTIGPCHPIQGISLPCLDQNSGSFRVTDDRHIFGWDWNYCHKPNLPCQRDPDRLWVVIQPF